MLYKEGLQYQLSLVRQKQAIGILGMIFAVAGGIAWFLQARIPALILWGIAIIIIFKLKRKNRTKY
jgi:4-hydroxybenzoate polyprenyltransferase